MSKHLVRVSDDFWNVRGSFNIFGVVDIGTHASLVRRNNGKFVFLDAYAFNEDSRREINSITNGGRDVEAILLVHPFHTVHVAAMHKAFPNAVLYGTARHRARFADLPWAPTLSEDPATHALFKEDFDFSIPRGLDFIPADQNVHSSSILVLHRASKALHVDDTFMIYSLPWPLRIFHPTGLVRFHPMVARALEQRAGAVRDFRLWRDEFLERFHDIEHLCAAHSQVLANATAQGLSIAKLLHEAFDKVEPTLRAHERKYG